jgi:hypothetical protein
MALVVGDKNRTFDEDLSFIDGVTLRSILNVKYVYSLVETCSTTDYPFLFLPVA